MTPFLWLALICVIATALVIIGGIRLAKAREGMKLMGESMPRQQDMDA